MNIFASWSGTDSQAVAELFREWLPNVLQEVDVWVSSQDIAKGDKWSQSLSENLSEHNFGILLVTKTNLAAPWLLFEAGALSKTVRSRVIPILCNVPALEIAGSPLNQFQHLTDSKEDILRLVESVNLECERKLPQDRLHVTFERWWPDFVKKFTEITFLEPSSSPKLTPKEADAARLEKIEVVLEAIMRSIKRLDSSNSTHGTTFLARKKPETSETKVVRRRDGSVVKVTRQLPNGNWRLVEELKKAESLAASAGGGEEEEEGDI